MKKTQEGVVVKEEVKVQHKRGGLDRVSVYGSRADPTLGIDERVMWGLREKTKEREEEQAQPKLFPSDIHPIR